MVADVDGKTALHWTANNLDEGTVKIILVSIHTGVRHFIW